MSVCVCVSRFDPVECKMKETKSVYSVHCFHFISQYCERYMKKCSWLIENARMEWQKKKGETDEKEEEEESNNSKVITWI